MKVKELIKELQKCNPDAHVMEYRTEKEVVDVVNEMASNSCVPVELVLE